MATINQALIDIQNGVAQLIRSVGTDFILTHDDDTTETIKAHVVPVGKDDTAIVNSLGVDVAFLHCLPTPAPKKFEKLTSPSGREYVIEAVHEKFTQNALTHLQVIAR